MRVAEQTTAPTNARAREFLLAQNPSGIMNRGFPIDELPYFIARLDSIKESIPGDSIRKQALWSLMRRLTVLRDLYALSTGRAEGWQAAAESMIASYCDDPVGLGHYCVVIATAG
jgi:hypothetical protein